MQRTQVLNMLPRLVTGLLGAEDRLLLTLFPVHGVPAVPVPAQCVYLYRHLYLDSPLGPGLLSCARHCESQPRTGFFAGPQPD